MFARHRCTIIAHSTCGTSDYPHADAPSRVVRADEPVFWPKTVLSTTWCDREEGFTQGRCSWLPRKGELPTRHQTEQSHLRLGDQVNLPPLKAIAHPFDSVIESSSSSGAPNDIFNSPRREPLISSIRCSSQIALSAHHWGLISRGRRTRMLGSWGCLQSF